MIINHSRESWDGLSSKVPNGMQNISCMDSVVICDTKQVTQLLKMKGFSNRWKSAPSSGYHLAVNRAERNKHEKHLYSVKAIFFFFFIKAEALSMAFNAMSHTTPERKKKAVRKRQLQCRKRKENVKQGD